VGARYSCSVPKESGILPLEGILMIAVLSTMALSLTLQVVDDPIQDGMSRNWEGLPSVTVKSDVVDNNDEAKRAKYACNREMSRTENRLRGRNQQILEKHDDCYLIKNEDGEGNESGYYQGKIWFNSN
jgi:hypothetical protein